MRQAELVQQFVLLAKSARGRGAAELIMHATSDPSLFAFSELLSDIKEVGARGCLALALLACRMRFYLLKLYVWAAASRDGTFKLLGPFETIRPWHLG